MQPFDGWNKGQPRRAETIMSGKTRERHPETGRLGSPLHKFSLYRLYRLAYFEGRAPFFRIARSGRYSAQSFYMSRKPLLNDASAQYCGMLNVHRTLRWTKHPCAQLPQASAW